MSALHRLRAEFVALQALAKAARRKKAAAPAPADAPAEGTHQGGHIYVAGGMGSFVKIPVRSVTMHTAPWAQHSNALHVEWVPAGARKSRGTVISPGSEFAYVPEGHEAPDPPSPWGEEKVSADGTRTRRSAYMSADARWWTDLRAKLPPTAVTYEGSDYQGGGTYRGVSRLARKHEHDGKDAAPPTTTPGVPTGATTQVSPHIRHTASGAVVQVAGHVRHLTAREAFKLKAAELRQHVETGGESGAVAQAELDRREAKRTGGAVTAPAPAARTAQAPAAKTAQSPSARAKTAKRWDPVEHAASMDRPLPAAEARRLAVKARAKGERLISSGEERNHHNGREGTHRQAAMAGNRREQAQADIDWGRRLVKLADQIEAGEFEPTPFDAQMVSNEQHANHIARWWRDHTEGRPDPYGRAPQKTDPWPADVWVDLQRRRTVSEDPKYHQDGDEELVARVNAAVDRYNAAARRWGRPDSEGNLRVAPHPEAAKELGAAETELDDLRKEAQKRRRFGIAPYAIGHAAKNLRASLAIGHVSTAHGADVHRRMARFRAATAHGTTTKTAKWAPPDRAHARDTFDDRLERAEKDEAKRWRAPEHGGITGFFPTPAPEVEHMIERADIRPGMSVLEPSAGTGDIADRLPGDVHITVAEHNHTLRGVLEQKGYTVAPDALEVSGQFDRVVMNPPFEQGQDMQHVMHAFEHNLKPGGRLVAIVGAGALSNSSKAHRAFQEFVAAHRADEDRPIRGDAWKRSGTSVNAVMITLDKPEDMVKAVHHRFHFAWHAERLAEAA